MRATTVFLGLAGAGVWLTVGCATLPKQPAPHPIHVTVLEPARTAPDSTGPLRLDAGGDVLPACYLDPYIKAQGEDYPYARIAPVFQAADVGLVNLECPLSARGRRYTKKKFTFRGRPAAAAALRRAGINVVALGNNHIMDYGAEALQDTLAALDQAGVAHAGAGETLSAARAPARLDLPGGVRAAILSYSLTYPAAFWAGRRNPGTAFARLPQVEADVASAAAWADWIAVCYHWGGELKTLPRAYQIQFGRAAIDAGAQVVIGSHPHILQGMEWYRGGLIAYSLGNLALGGGRSKRAVDSALLKVTLDPNTGSLGAWVLPLSVDNLVTRFIPTPVTGTRAGRIISDLHDYSRAWSTRFAPGVEGWFRVLPPALPPAPTLTEKIVPKQNPVPIEPERGLGY